MVCPSAVPRAQAQLLVLLRWVARPVYLVALGNKLPEPGGLPVQGFCSMTGHEVNPGVVDSLCLLRCCDPVRAEDIQAVISPGVVATHGL